MKLIEIIVIHLINPKMKVGEISRKMVLIQIKIGLKMAKMEAGSIITSLESFKICTNHCSPKIIPSLNNLTFWKKN